MFVQRGFCQSKRRETYVFISLYKFFLRQAYMRRVMALVSSSKTNETLLQSAVSTNGSAFLGYKIGYVAS